MKQFDIVIVGNGILGYSTAFALQQESPQLKIAIIGSDNNLGGATLASGAMLGCFGEVTNTTLKTKPAQAKFEMSVQAASLWDSWLEQINSYVPDEYRLIINRGTFILLNTKSGRLDTENYSAILEALNTYHEPYETIKPDHIPETNPIDTSRPLNAIYIPNEGTINSNQLLQNLRLALSQNKNIEFINDNAESLVLKKDTNQITQLITTKQQYINTNSVIIAAGAYSQTLIDQIPDLAYRIPRLFFGCGIAITVQGNRPTVKHLIRTPNRSFACGLHLLPRDNNTYYIGATNNVELTPEVYPRMGTAHFLLQCAMEQLNQDFHNFKIMGWHVGNRPASIDTYPLIGETSVRGLWLLAGTYRDGLHQSPLLAKYIARKLLNNESTFQNIFEPERLPIQTMTREEAIQEAVKHYMSGAYEHAMNMPKVGWDKMFESMIYNKIKQLYEDLDTDYVLPPDFLLMFDNDREKHLSFFRNYYKTIEKQSTLQNHTYQELVFA